MLSMPCKIEGGFIDHKSLDKINIFMSPEKTKENTIKQWRGVCVFTDYTAPPLDLMYSCTTAHASVSCPISYTRRKNQQ